MTLFFIVAFILGARFGYSLGTVGSKLNTKFQALKLWFRNLVRDRVR